MTIQIENSEHIANKFYLLLEDSFQWVKSDLILTAYPNYTKEKDLQFDLNLEEAFDLLKNKENIGFEKHISGEYFMRCSNRK